MLIYASNQHLLLGAYTIFPFPNQSQGVVAFSINLDNKAIWLMASIQYL